MTDLDGQETSNRGAELGTPAKTKRQKKVRDLYAEQPVLRTESKDDFAQIRAEFIQDLGPKDSIEKEFVNDVAYYSWDIRRLRRIKTGILNNALKGALESILRQILFPSFHPSVEFLRAPMSLAHDWLSDPEAKLQVSRLLQESGFDDSAIEAQAYRRVADHLEGVDRRLIAAQQGREKALRSISKYRKSFADRLRWSSDRVIAADEVRTNVSDAVN